MAKYAIDDGQLAPDRQVPDHGAAPEADHRSRTVDLFLASLSVTPLRARTADGTSHVLEVTLACTDPVLAPKALQSFLDNYLQLGARQNRRLGEAASRLTESRLAQARDDLRQSQDRIVALLSQEGGGTRHADAAADAGLRLDLSPGVVGSTPAVGAARPQALALPLRLDDARPLATDDAGNVRHAPAPRRIPATLRETTPLETELARLERMRQAAQDRDAALQDQLDRSFRMDPAEAAHRVIIDAPDHPAVADGRSGVGALPGPIAGLLVGVMLAVLREFGRDRMRTSGEAAHALGVPVLGAIPTLSAKAMTSYFRPSGQAPGAGVADRA